MSRTVSIRRRRSGALVAAFLTAVSLPLRVATAQEGLAGSQGTDTALPPTDSAVTVSGRPCPSDMDVDVKNPGCGFGNLQIKVNQTKGLINQAVSVTWTGGQPPVKENREPAEGGENVFGNFLQIFQCWGEDDGTNAINPGPPPEQCQFGGFQSTARDANLLVQGNYPFTRIVSSVDRASYDSGDGVKNDDLLWKPFRSVDGTVVDVSADFDALNQGAGGTGAFWLNTNFNAFTTNELPVARSQGTTGSEVFTVATGLEAAGLGCGQRLEQKDGSKRTPKCWLVVVPRSTGAAENPDPADPDGQRPSDAEPVLYSPLAQRSWRNRIAVPLEFKPVDSACAIGASERALAGSELAGPAVSSWQPKLCAAPGSPPYSYSPLSDDRARQQVATAAPGAPGMAVVSQPIDPASLQPENPAVYAPLSLSGVTVGFNIERRATRSLQDGRFVAKDPAEVPLEGIRVARIQLTPRLVAKLLTQSYKDQLDRFGGGFYEKPEYTWHLRNPNNLLVDPDFVQFNPEFANLEAGSSTGAAGRVLVELPSSDAAHEVWRWVLADPEAKAWLAGAEAPGGMKVNPFYSTDAKLHPSGTPFGEPIPNSYPKSDPFCAQVERRLPSAQNQFPRPVCMNEISPYVNSMEEAALATRAARDRSLTKLDENALTPDAAWKPEPPHPPGLRMMLSVTDTASAARYGLQTARLSQAGDNAPNRAFVAPDEAGLLAGQRAMVTSQVPGVLRPDPAARVAGAYPLTMLTYGAALPASLDAAARKDYAAFLDYAAGPGQIRGLDIGQLPAGYAPLPADLRAQTKVTAAALRKGPAAPGPGPSGSGTGAAGRGDGPSATDAFSPDPGAPSEDSTSTNATPAPGPSPGPPAITSPLVLPPPPPGVVPIVDSIPTPKEVAGFVRFVMPIVVGLGLLALLGIMIIDDRWFRALAARVKRPSAHEASLEAI